MQQWQYGSSKHMRPPPSPLVLVTRGTKGGFSPVVVCRVLGSPSTEPVLGSQTFLSFVFGRVPARGYSPQTVSEDPGTKVGHAGVTPMETGGVGEAGKSAGSQSPPQPRCLTNGRVNTQRCQERRWGPAPKNTQSCYPENVGVRIPTKSFNHFILVEA